MKTGRLIIYLLLPVLWDITLKAQSSYPFPEEVNPAEVAVHAINKNCVTAIRNETLELWQFKLGSKHPVSHFKAGADFDQYVYERKFKDNGKTYQKTRHAYEVNGGIKKLCEVTDYWIDKTNNVYALVSGVEPTTPASSMFGPVNPEKDFIMIPFMEVLKILDGKISETWVFREHYEKEGYHLDIGSFFRDAPGFVFTVRKQRMDDGHNSFLGKWSINGSELTFAGIVDVDLPAFFRERGIGYGLLDFIKKDDWLMFYASPYICNLAQGSSARLDIKNIPESPYAGHGKGGSFNINFAICDFIIGDKEIHVITRKKDQFYLEHFDLKTFTLKSAKQLPNISPETVRRFPFFTSTGEAVILPVSNRNIIITRE